MQKEAAWVLANVMHGYQSDPSLHAANRVRTLVQMGCLGASPYTRTLTLARAPHPTWCSTSPRP